MMQIIITYIIVGFAFSITLLKLYEFMFKKANACACSGGCSLKSELTKNIKPKKKWAISF